MGDIMFCMGYNEAVEILKKKADNLRAKKIEIAEGSHISVSQVSRIFAFKSVGSQETLVAIAKYLKVPSEKILRELGALTIVPESEEIDEQIKYIIGKFKRRGTKKRALRLLEVMLSSEQEDDEDDFGEGRKYAIQTKESTSLIKTE